VARTELYGKSEQRGSGLLGADANPIRANSPRQPRRLGSAHRQQGARAIRRKGCFRGVPSEACETVDGRAARGARTPQRRRRATQSVQRPVAEREPATPQQRMVTVQPRVQERLGTMRPVPSSGLWCATSMPRF
jgi:hypothetical protein